MKVFFSVHDCRPSCDNLVGAYDEHPVQLEGVLQPISSYFLPDPNSDGYEQKKSPQINVRTFSLFTITKVLKS